MTPPDYRAGPVSYFDSKGPGSKPTWYCCTHRCSSRGSDYKDPPPQPPDPILVTYELFLLDPPSPQKSKTNLSTYGCTFFINRYLGIRNCTFCHECIFIHFPLGGGLKDSAKKFKNCCPQNGVAKGKKDCLRKNPFAIGIIPPHRPSLVHPAKRRKKNRKSICRGRKTQEEDGGPPFFSSSFSL